MRRWLKITLLVLVFLAVLIGIAPSLANWGPVRGWILDRARAEIGRDLDVESIEAGWSGPVSVRGLVVAGQQADATPPLRAEHVVIDGALLDLARGKGERVITVTRPEMFLEARGDRSNIDDLITRFAPPPPPDGDLRFPPGYRPPTPIPMHVIVHDGSLSMAHLPRAKTTYVDPFVADPRVRPASEGALRVMLTAIELDLRVRGRAGSATFAATSDVAGVAGSARGQLTWTATSIEGEVDADGFDLAWLEPLLGFSIQGRGTIHATAKAGRYEVRARLNEVAASGIGALDVREEFVELQLEADDDGPRTLELTSASETIQATWTRGENGAFETAGQAPLALVLAALGEPRAKGIVHFDAHARPDDGGLAWQGDVTLTHVRLKDATGQVSGPTNITLETKGRWASSTLRGTVVAKAPEFALQSAIEATRTKAGWHAQARGDGTVRFDPWATLLAPWLAMPDQARVRGELQWKHDVARRVDGTVSVDLTGQSEDVSWQGFGEADANLGSVPLRIDAAWDPKDQLVRLVDLTLGRLSARGVLRGVNDRATMTLDGRVSGKVRIPPMLAGRLGLENLGGRAHVDLKADSDGAQTRVKGTIALHDVLVGANNQVVQTKRVHIVADARGHGGQWSLESSVSGMGDWTAQTQGVTWPLTESARVVLRGPLAQLPHGEDKLDVRGDATITVGSRGDGEYFANVHAPNAALRYDDSPWRRDQLRVDATWIDGDTANAEIRLVHHDLYLDVTAKAPFERFLGSLSMPVEGFQRVTASIALTRGTPWRAQVSSARNGLTVNVNATLDDSFAATFSAEGPWRAVREWVPELGAKGNLTLRGTARLDERKAVVIDGTFWSDYVAWDTHSAEFVDSKFKLRVPIDFEREATASATIRARKGVAADARWTTLAGELQADGLVHSLERLGTTGAFTVARVEAEGAVLTKARIDQTGNGKRWLVTVRAPKVEAEGATARDITLQSNLQLGQKTTRARVSFGGGQAQALTWGAGSADLALAANELRIENASIRVHDGLAKGNIRLNTSNDKWTVKLTTKDFKLRESAGEVLGFIVPILRMRAGRAGERKLSGLLDAELALSGRGFDLASWIKSLDGQGRIRLRQVEITGSHLLPLLSLRVDRLLSRRPYRFSDLDVPFRVNAGRVRANDFELRGEPFPIHVSGSAGLDGSLDFIVKPVLGVVPIPLRVRGTFDNPKVRAAPLRLVR